VLTRWTSRDNKDQRCEAVEASRAHELKERKRDLERTEAEVQAKMEEMAQNYQSEDVETMKEDLTELIVLKGHQQARIADLGPDRDVTVAYEEARVGESVVLALGQLCRVPFLSESVVFQRGPLEALEAKTEEEKVSREVQLLAWRDGQLGSGGFEFAFGTYGSGDGQFQSPTDLAVSEGRVYVADNMSHRISVHELDGTFVSAFGSRGSGDGQFQYPIAVAAAGEHLFIADSANHRIVVTQCDGTFVRSFGGEGSGDGQFQKPWGLAVAEHRIYVADTHNHRVLVHGLDGAFEFAFGSKGSGDGQFDFPV
jgi:hypothetical protein